MPIQTSYARVQTDFAIFWNEVVRNQEVVIIKKPGTEDVALIAASELSSLIETAHVFKSSKNAERLLTALERAQANTVAPQTIEELRYD